MAKKKKKGSLFWKIFAVMLCLLVVGAALLLKWGYGLMLDYDETQSYPIEHTRELAAAIASGDYSVLYETGDRPNPFTFEKETYEESVRTAVSENGITVEKGFSSDRYSKPVYIIKAGELKIATVEYKLAAEKSKHGFDVYEFSSLVPNVGGVYAIRVLVPEGCSLKIGGVTVDESYIIDEPVTITPETDCVYGTEPVTYNYYYVDALMNEPEAQIVYNDTGLDAAVVYSGEYEAWTVETYGAEISAPSNYKVYIGATCVSDDARYVKASGGEISIIKNAQQYTTGTVSVVTYSVSGLRYESDCDGIYAIDFEGTRREPQGSAENNSYTFGCGITPEDFEKYGISEELLIKRAVDYSRFVSNDGNRNTDVLPYVLENSAVYNEFKDFWATLSAHDSYWIENKTLNHLYFYSEELFVADVSFDYWIKGYNHLHDNTKCYSTTVVFWYVKVNGEWKIADFSLYWPGEE